ncbi:unnamed protein product [Cuscuta epithymum]|uniref:Lipoyl-binding domain-containing protein n=1 Tax=Cuscuta epithymum TaxID=186058 RepID=A0AAV0DHA9_9ASTE|nr:unnamed protein product [Cuscuta epithymum]
MESAAVLRSFHHPLGTSNLKSVLEMPGVVPMNSSALSKFEFPGKLIFMHSRHNRFVVSYAKPSKTNASENLNGAAILDESQLESLNGKHPQLQATFPDGIEALITEVCDSKEIAELRLKAGGFEMHLKRKVEGATVLTPVFTPSPPTTQSEPVTDSLVTASSVPNPSGKSSPFVNISAEKSAKLAEVDAFETSGHVLISSNTVGVFRRSKNEKDTPACKEGDVIRKGQRIGFVDQFDCIHPVIANVGGKVAKFLYDDGEAIGYGDALVAVLP